MKFGDAITGQKHLLTALAIASTVLMGCEMQMAGGGATGAGNGDTQNPGGGTTNPGGGTTNPGGGTTNPGGGTTNPGGGTTNPGGGTTNPGGGTTDPTKPEQPEPFAWYLKDTGTYLAFDAQGEFQAYRCSIAGKYELDDSFSGSKSGSNLTVKYTTGEQASYTIGQSSFNVGNGIDVAYQVTNAVPATCTKDAIEITRVTPTSLNAGSGQDIEVTVQYRLSSANSAVLEFGYTVAENGNYKAIHSDSITVNGSGNTEKKTFTVTPVDHGSNTPYAVHVNLSQSGRSGNYLPLASDFERISVN